MVLKYFLSLVLFFSLVLGRFSYAQEPDNQCMVVQQGIVDLIAPEVGERFIWARPYGVDGVHELFQGGVTWGEGIVMVGRRHNPQAGEAKVLLVRFNELGRTDWEKEMSIGRSPEMLNVRKAFLFKGLLTVLVDIKEDGKHSGWLGFFDQDGALKHSIKLSDPKGSYEVRDIIGYEKDGSFLISGVVRESDKQGELYPVFKRISSNGSLQDEKRLTFGLDSKINKLIYLEEMNWTIGLGTATDARGQQSGWIVGLGPGGRLDWDLPHTRGAAAELVTGAVIHGYNAPSGAPLVLAAGYSDPAAEEEQPRAAWVAAFDASNGQMVWQRYYRAEKSLEVMDVQALPDGRVNVLISASGPADPETADVIAQTYDHGRVLLHDPRGRLLDVKDLFYEKGVKVSRIVPGNEIFEGYYVSGQTMIAQEEGLIAQSSEQGGADMGDEEIIPEFEEDGLLLAFEPEEPYEDPCLE